MAVETLDVNTMLPTRFEPLMKFRYYFGIQGIDAYICKKVDRPKLQIEPKEIPWMNTTRYIAGKAKWQTMQLTLFEPISPSGAQQIMEWVRTHYDSVSGRAGYADFYKRDCQLKLVDPVGNVVQLWDIKGAQITDFSPSDVDYESSDMTTIDLTLQFDNCILQF